MNTSSAERCDCEGCKYQWSLLDYDVRMYGNGYAIRHGEHVERLDPRRFLHVTALNKGGKLYG